MDETYNNNNNISKVKTALNFNVNAYFEANDKNPMHTFRQI